MKIAVMADGCDVDCKVAETFAAARWLLIVDMDHHCICETLERSAADAENQELARVIVDRDCESVICGAIAKIPFDILADGGVTRSLGSGLSVTDALNCESLLELITDCIGGTGCGSSDHNHAQHCCGQHDDSDL